MSTFAQYLSDGNSSCSSSSENVTQFLTYTTGCTDAKYYINDMVNTLGATACGNQGTLGCVYEAPFDGVVEMLAPWLTKP